MLNIYIYYIYIYKYNIYIYYSILVRFSRKQMPRQNQVSKILLSEVKCCVV